MSKSSNRLIFLNNTKQTYISKQIFAYLIIVRLRSFYYFRKQRHHKNQIAKAVTPRRLYNCQCVQLMILLSTSDNTVLGQLT